MRYHRDRAGGPVQSGVAAEMQAEQVLRPGRRRAPAGRPRPPGRAAPGAPGPFQHGANDWCPGYSAEASSSTSPRTHRPDAHRLGDPPMPPRLPGAERLLRRAPRLVTPVRIQRAVDRLVRHRHEAAAGVRHAQVPGALLGAPSLVEELLDLGPQRVVLRNRCRFRTGPALSSSRDTALCGWYHGSFRDALPKGVLPTCAGVDEILASLCGVR